MCNKCVKIQLSKVKEFLVCRRCEQAGFNKPEALKLVSSWGADNPEIAELINTTLPTNLPNDKFLV
jgi:hypothetical protein